MRTQILHRRRPHGDTKPDYNPKASAKHFHAFAAAVLTAYGFSAKKDLLAQLLALNQEVAAKIE